MESAEEILADLDAGDDALLAALTDRRETVLWFEHDLHDQLRLIQILAATWQMEEAPYLGDSWIFRRIDELAQGKRALLERGENHLRLTAEGQRALAG
jgi:hypothetical protein